MTEDSGQLGACRELLLKAGRLYERHEAGRPEPFNVFSVLRKETDEVHLHSRFLTALLDYRRSRDSPDSPRENLAEFLRLPSVDMHHLNPKCSSVDREFKNIDILIRDPRSKHAVVIENKIWAEDQHRQLQRYDEELKKEGYVPHLLYLTLDGRAPSEDSGGDLQYRCISYKEDLRPWLRGCQERAYDEPALRESVAQYLHLVEKLTGTDYSEGYMNALKKLCLQDDNLVLVHDLNEAMVEASIALLCKLWKEIDCKVKEKIPDLHCKQSEEKSDITESAIRKICFGKRGFDHGLYYGISAGANFGITGETSDPRSYFGVRCLKRDHEDEHDRFRRLADELGALHNDAFPCYRLTAPTSLNLRNPTREDLRILANQERRNEYVDQVVTDVRGLWEMIKRAGLA